MRTRSWIGGHSLAIVFVGVGLEAFRWALSVILRRKLWAKPGFLLLLDGFGGLCP